MSEQMSFKRLRQFGALTPQQCSVSPGARRVLPLPYVNPGPSMPVLSLNKGFIVDQFPHIKRHDEALYRLAILAGSDFKKAKRFEKTYGLVIRMLNDVSLHLDEQGKLAIAFTQPKSIGKLLTGAIVDKLAGEIKGKGLMDTIDNISGGKLLSETQKSRLAKFNVVLASIASLLEIYKDIDHKELVQQQAGKRKDEARKKKVKFCLAAIAATRLGTAKTTQFTNLYISLYEKFVSFESTLSVWGAFVAFESKLAGTFQTVPQRQFRLPSRHARP